MNLTRAASSGRHRAQANDGQERGTEADREQQRRARLRKRIEQEADRVRRRFGVGDVVDVGDQAVEHRVPTLARRAPIMALPQTPPTARGGSIGLGDSGTSMRKEHR